MPISDGLFNLIKAPVVNNRVLDRIPIVSIALYMCIQMGPIFRFSTLLSEMRIKFFSAARKLRQDLVSFFEEIGAGTDELQDHVLRSEKKILLSIFTTQPTILQSSQR